MSGLVVKVEVGKPLNSQEPTYAKTALCQAMCREMCLKYDHQVFRPKLDKEELPPTCDDICKRFLMSCDTLKRTKRYPKSF